MDIGTVAIVGGVVGLGILLGLSTGQGNKNTPAGTTPVPSPVAT